MFVQNTALASTEVEEDDYGMCFVACAFVVVDGTVVSCCCCSCCRYTDMGAGAPQ